MKKVFEYSLVEAGDDSPFAVVWWTGRKIDSNNLGFLRTLKQMKVNNCVITDGLPFFWNIPLLFLNGRITVKRTK